MPSHSPIKKCVVQPIQQPGDIERVRDALKTRPRDLLLFDLLTRSGAGLKGILNLRAAALMPNPFGRCLVYIIALENRAVYYFEGSSFVSLAFSSAFPRILPW